MRQNEAPKRPSVPAVIQPDVGVAELGQRRRDAVYHPALVGQSPDVGLHDGLRHGVRTGLGALVLVPVPPAHHRGTRPSYSVVTATQRVTKKGPTLKTVIVAVRARKVCMVGREYTVQVPVAQAILFSLYFWGGLDPPDHSTVDATTFCAARLIPEQSGANNTRYKVVCFKVNLI